MTAKKWTAEQKLEVVLAGLRNEGSTAELCRRYGISHSTFPTGSCKETTFGWSRRGRGRMAKTGCGLSWHRQARGGYELRQRMIEGRGEHSLRYMFPENPEPM